MQRRPSTDRSRSATTIGCCDRAPAPLLRPVTGARALVGLDIGTTGIKAVAFDAAGTELAKVAEETPTHRTADGGGEYLAEEIWDSCCRVIRRVNRMLDEDGHEPVAIAAASIGESGVPLDPNGVATHPIIAWFDRRTEDQVHWWREHVGEERTTEITALPTRPVFGMLKLVWTREHAPEAFARTTRWLNMADYAAFRLSGAMITDHSLASRTLAFDIIEREWSTELLDAAAIPASMLGDLVPSGQVVGHVHDDAASATGLPTGTPVVSGGQDHVCAALALGITEPGDLLDSIGTAEALFMITDGPDCTGPIASAGISQGAHVVPGRTYAMTGLAQGGGRIDSVRRKLGLEWDAFLALAAKGGPAHDVVEEVALVSQAAIDRLIEAVGRQPTRHLATGGGARNDLLLERKRAIGGRPIEVPDVGEATCLGAALLAGAGIGIYPSVLEAPAAIGR